VHRIRALVALALLFAAVAASAGEATPPVLELAPLYGADVRSLAFDPGDPDVAFAGTSAGHVYRSDDGGSSWRDAGDAVPFPGWVVGSLVFDPHRSGRLWVGLWGIWGGGSVAVSDDGGKSWALRRDGLPEDDQVYALTAVPGAPGHLLAATRTGVYRTEDDGATWSPAATGPGPDHVSSLLVDPDDPRRILAGTWRRAWRSDDGGRSWRGAFEGMVLDSEVFSIQPVPGRAGELWASTCGWVYRGSGFGERWERVKTGFEERRTPSLLVLSPERILAGTVAGLHVSIDGGRSFRRTSDARLPILALARHPQRPDRVLIGTEGAGIWLSQDGGETMTSRLVATSNLRVQALAAVDATVFAAVVHAGPLSGVYRSSDQGTSFEPRPAELPTVLDLAVSRGAVFAATERGLFERSGTEWRRVGELGERRIDQVVGAGNRLIARSGSEVWELGPDARFAPQARLPGPVRSIAFAWGELWVRAEDALWRVPPVASPVPTSLPDPGAHTLLASGGELLLAGPHGLWRRAEPSGPWQELARGRSRSLATRDDRFPLLLASGGELRLIGDDGAARLALRSPFPASETLSALVAGDRLWIGTSGFGLWSVALPVEDRRAELAQPADSDSRIRR